VYGGYDFPSEARERYSIKSAQSRGFSGVLVLPEDALESESLRLAKADSSR
jgi:hypothetical protein